MLTEMQNTVGSMIDPSSTANPDRVPASGSASLTASLTAAGKEPESMTKSIPIHRSTESLRYLLQHLTASWVSRAGVCSEVSERPLDPQEP
jgi:hypothetical protein